MKIILNTIMLALFVSIVPASMRAMEESKSLYKFTSPEAAQNAVKTLNPMQGAPTALFYFAGLVFKDIAIEDAIEAAQTGTHGYCFEVVVPALMLFTVLVTKGYAYNESKKSIHTVYLSISKGKISPNPDTIGYIVRATQKLGTAILEATAQLTPAEKDNIKNWLLLELRLRNGNSGLPNDLRRLIAMHLQTSLANDLRQRIILTGAEIAESYPIESMSHLTEQPAFDTDYLLECVQLQTLLPKRNLELKQDPKGNESEDFNRMDLSE